ncbi:exoribonuclease family protein [Cucurbitaria berberidis CBS 394.84]|uniref:Exoribonuclease family protein n=1 Tax=Cucurbitaria berberidis CBS 394.84 TaxID=1168544 RepID=A0A9P4GJU0_9PLEO|nr:exoribonuclease family protein [Cucurbitaria berberidis CBS 394.84]KAF1846749.1 exoribonuclease family protein [Cucurbitaria berberidis CBS 394.84]
MARRTFPRRNNAPSGGTCAPVFARTIKEPGYLQTLRPSRSRGSNELRKIFLQTSIIPSASGSAYLEIPSSSPASKSTLIPPTSSLKITASVQGPKPLPRSVPFSPSLLLTTTVKFAPFATRHRRGYIRDSIERDLGVHLETALRGVIIGERWPKSGVEVVITILEGDEDGWWGDSGNDGSVNRGGWGLLNVLAGCITVASAAITDAGIDCVDVVCGGVAALTRDPAARDKKELVRILDPCPAEHKEIVAACAVGYLASRDEITEIWMKGDVGADPNALVEGATHAAVGSLAVVKEVLLEALQAKFQGPMEGNESGLKRKAQDVEMTG